MKRDCSRIGNNREESKMEMAIAFGTMI